MLQHQEKVHKRNDFVMPDANPNASGTKCDHIPLLMGPRGYFLFSEFYLSWVKYYLANGNFNFHYNPATYLSMKHRDSQLGFW